MKRKLMIGLLILFALLLLVLLYLKDGKFITAVEKYRVYSNKGLQIPARLYIEDKNISRRYLLIFDTKESFTEDHGLLLINTKEKSIGVPELSSNEIIKIGKNKAYQLKGNPNPINVINNKFFFEDSLLDYAIFGNNKVTFNSYGPLKQFGDSIIIELK